MEIPPSQEVVVITGILSDLKVVVPELTRPMALPADVLLVNANPQCGPFPFENVMFEADLAAGHAVFRADLSESFVEAQILPRGRPHFSLLHVALVDDAVAVSSLTGITGEEYGKHYRYIELGAAAGFHREAFIRGTMTSRQFGTIFVDGFRVRWRCLPSGRRGSLLERGVFQVSVLGLNAGDEIPVVSVEGQYFRRRAVKNLFIS